MEIAYINGYAYFKLNHNEHKALVALCSSTLYHSRYLEAYNHGMDRGILDSRNNDIGVSSICNDIASTDGVREATHNESTH